VIIMTAFNKAWIFLKESSGTGNTYDEEGKKAPGGPYDWQGLEFDSHCPKCGKGIYWGTDDSAAMSMIGSCLECL